MIAKGRKSIDRFTILDAMFLVVAVGVGFGIIRIVGDDPFNRDIRWRIVRGSWAIALPVTWGLAALRLTRSHLPRRRRFRPPGTAACLAVVVASSCMLVFWAHNIVRLLQFSSSRADWFAPTFWRMAFDRILDPMPLAASVAATWVLMIVGGRWCPEPSWSDRMGRVTATFWLAAGLAIPILNILQNWR